VIRNIVGNTDFYKKVLTQSVDQNSTVTNVTSNDDTSTPVHKAIHIYADAVRSNVVYSENNTKQNKKKIHFNDEIEINTYS